jgi:4-hydroxy-2-oxoheptanedioate aldolase
VEYKVRPNKLKEKRKRGERVPGVLLDILSPDLLEVFALAGYQTVMFEGEHHALDENLYVSLIRVAEMYDMTPTIRFRTIQPGPIARLLDIGIQGITATHIHSAEDLKNLIRCAKYPPEGERGFGRFSRLNKWGMADEAEAIKAGNDALWLGGLVEDMEGVEHLDEILAVEGIDSIGIGASDLTASMGHPGDYDHPEVVKVMDRIGESMKRAGRPWTVPRFGRYTGASGTLLGILLKEHLERSRGAVGPG